jgi:hypothetical protein
MKIQSIWREEIRGKTWNLVLFSKVIGTNMKKVCYTYKNNR